ncbi:MAG: hypothetical protein JWL63_747 [Rhodocyclales bacterium]|nr:hypothetical protein [Rhodocyclales bacterium]
MSVKPPATIPFAWSPLLCVAIGLAHIFPLASVLAESVPGWVRWAVVPLCLVSAMQSGFVAMRLRNARLCPHSEGAKLILPDAVLEGRMLPSSVDMGALIVLHWQADAGGKVRRYALLRDAFTAEDWRTLKVWLRWSIMMSSA